MVKIERQRKEKGYSLVEVMVAMTILIVGILPVISMFPQVLTVMQKSTENEERARIGLQVIEFMKLGGYNNLLATANSANNEGFVDLEAGNGTFDADDFETLFITPYIRFPDPPDPQGYFRLNAKKGMNLANTVIYWSVTNVNVALVPTFGGVIVDPHYNNFVVGAVVVGTGRDVSNTITGKEKETRMQFIVTPIE